MADHVDTIIIGGGQAGLAMSYHLSQRGRNHIVLERGRVAERWRSERWDSLMFQFPNWSLSLPGQTYEGDAPERFMPRDGVVDFIASYANRIRAPLRCGVEVTALKMSTGKGRFAVECDAFTLAANNVVVATGPYQEPRIPAFSAALPAAVYQITANRYTNPRELPPGRVLVVGAGASGYQIAEDLVQSGREIYCSVGRHRRIPRRYRGRDITWWQDVTGVSDQTADRLPQDGPPLLLTGVNGGQDADFRRLAHAGAKLAGTLQGIDGDNLRFAANLADHLAEGDASLDEYRRTSDAYIAEHDMAAAGSEAPASRPTERVPSGTGPPIEALSLQSSGINSVIWATGYRYNFRWVQCPVFDRQGAPQHHRGVTSIPGLYFLGLRFLHKVKSSFLSGVGEDADYLAKAITQEGTSEL